MKNRTKSIVAASFIALALGGCGKTELRPVEIFPEDMCSDCRMSISDATFASEIIDAKGEVYKFDDLGCLESFRKKSSSTVISALFVMACDTKEWIPFNKSTIVQTGLRTPMASGKMAFANASSAKKFAEAHPMEAEARPSCCVESRSTK